MIRAALLMLAKDMRLFMRDRVGLALAVALPIVLVSVFGMIMSNMGGGGGGMPTVEASVLDLDHSEASARFVKALAQSEAVDLEGWDEDTPSTREGMRQRVSDGGVAFVVVLPEGFGEGAEMELIRDPGRKLAQQLFTFSLLQALHEARGQQVFYDIQHRALRQAGIPEEWMWRVEAFTLPFRLGMNAIIGDADEAGLLTEDEAEEDESFDMVSSMTAIMPMTTEDVLPAGRQKRISYHVALAVSGMTVMMLMFSLVSYARSLLEERDQGTLNRLFLAPVDQRAVLASKFLGTFVVGLLLTGILFAWASFLFDIELLSRWDTLLVVSMATSAAVTGFALLIACLAKTDKQADGMSTIVILVMSAVGGAWVPLNMMPEIVRQCARGTITFWSMEGYQASFYNNKHWTSAAILTDIAVLAGVCIAFSLLASRIFRGRYLRS